MQIKINSSTFFVFDLDDTLYNEIEFLKSGYRHIAGKLTADEPALLFEEMYRKYSSGENVFEWLLQKFGGSIAEVDKTWLLNEYRHHEPQIRLSQETSEFLQRVRGLNIPAGLITDGRSITQRNKLKALGLHDYFQDIIISEEFGSEKPDRKNYLHFQHKYPDRHFYFFGDNTSKDFIVPNQLGWTTICLKNSGHHIHSQSFEKMPRPDHLITSFVEVDLLES